MKAKTGIVPQRLFIISLMLLISGTSIGWAQAVSPPPGFAPSPAGNDEPDYSPPPQRTFSGSSSDIESDRTYNSIDNPTPRRYGARPEGRVFRAPPTPEIILDNDPPMPRVWFRAEGLYWWSKSMPLPVPVVTEGSAADPNPGAIGQPGTTVLIGNQNMSIPGQGGGRFSLGFSFDAQQTWGAELSYFYLSNGSSWQGVSSDGSSGSAILAFPFYNPTLPGEDASLIASPGNYAGMATVSVISQLNGTDVNFIHNEISSNGFRLDLLGGFRNVNLKEGLELDTSSPNVPPGPAAFFNTYDQFITNNHFYGAQAGVRASYDVNRFFMNATGKLAIGGMFENVNASGGTFTNVGGSFASAPGAFLTQPTNIGSVTRDQFAFIPEMNLNFGFRLRPWCSVLVGYSFLYISSVARPGEQIDRNINPSQSPAISGNFTGTVTGPAVPQLSVHNTDFWAQGLNFALEFRF